MFLKSNERSEVKNK